MDLGLRGRAAFVAASSKGMGRAIAEQFAAEGADVGMCARSDATLQAAAESVRSHGGRVFATVADVADPEQARLAVDRTVMEFGRLDALVVNAGGPPRASFADLDDQKFDAAYQLTFMSAVHLVQAALPALSKSDAGAILFITSTSVKQPISGLTLSNSIRGSVSGLAKTLSNELAPTIRVNSLLPGAIRTDRQIETGACIRSHRPGRVLRARRRDQSTRTRWRARRDRTSGSVSLLTGGVIRHGRFACRRRWSDTVRRLTNTASTRVTARSTGGRRAQDRDDVGQVEKRVRENAGNDALRALIQRRQHESHEEQR